jgi:uncharacterized protein
MAEVRNSPEPSMEEILASIRRIIVEDDDPLPKASAGPGEVTNDAAALASTRAPGQARPLRVAGTDAAVAAAPPTVVQEPLSASAPAQDTAFDLSRRSDGAEVTCREPKAISPARLSPADPGRFDPPPAENETADAEARTARLAASVAMLTKIATIGQAARPPELPLGDVGRTLEDMVRELLRPHMKEWLDAHLPQLVERLVRDEIAQLLREAQQH